MKTTASLLCAALLFFPAPLRPEAGVLIPSGREQPDDAVLALAEMDIRIVIDNNHARVQTRQIFSNRTAGVLEGNYTFALPSRALVSDFAVWDDVTRIPGVILERRRAEEIYEAARLQAIDPGLLQAGERDADQARRSAVFTARIVPIPAWGTKRVELEYQERLAVEGMQSYFALPLRPDAYRAIAAGRLSISLDIRSNHRVRDFEQIGKAYPLKITERTANRIRAEWEAQNVTFSEDLALRYRFDDSSANALDILAYREAPSGPGFFLGSVILREEGKESSGGPPRNIIALFDTSLSMQWEKLERSYLALERLLRAARPTDTFNVVAFNSTAKAWAPSPVPATPAAVEKALEWVRSARLTGGTDLNAAFEVALGQSKAETYFVLLSDGAPTEGPDLRTAKIADWYAARVTSIPPAQQPRLYVFAVGDDANLPLLRQLSGETGTVEWLRSTEPPDFKLQSFLSKIGRRPAERLELTAEPKNNFDLVYPLEKNVFGGSMAAWAGQYKQPGNAKFTVRAVHNGRQMSASKSVQLPAVATEHDHVPRTWAKARVDALLEKIDRDGEDRDSIDEIIRLARKYKFVTPYTSFLAAPRALLRPRLIRPGDPILRVRTDKSVKSVVAMFPFGLVKSLRYLPEEDVWQTRFLAPTDMPDGTHQVRLILKDRAGRAFRETKSFVIISKPPIVRVRVDKGQYRRGEIVRVRASASDTARTIIARMYGAGPVSLRWNNAANASTGEFAVPAHLSAGRYSIRVTAEDFAHNIGSGEVQIEVLP